MARTMAACLLAVASAGSSATAAPVEPTSFTTRKVGKTVYFAVEFNAPKDFARDPLPTLVPLDEQTKEVLLDAKDLTDRVVPLWLRFVGRRAGDAKSAKLRLAYARPGKETAGAADVTLDWVKAESLDAVAWLDSADLPGQWRRLRDAELARHAGLERSGGFPGLVEHLHDGKHGVDRPPLVLPRFPHRQSRGQFNLFPVGPLNGFDLTTGATALDESLALRRDVPTSGGAAGGRTVDVTTIRGIDIAEHPWKKMIGATVPAPEPLARLVPHDNWYLTVGDPTAFVRAWEVLDTWGGSVLRSPTVQDRHYGTRARYERQLCLPSGDVAKSLPAGLVEAVALTGSDLFWLEGSDVTALVQVTDAAAFRKLHDGLITQARKEAKHTTEEVGGVTVDSWVSPRREVSLHRATVGNVVVCSNSPAALRHVLAVHAGKRPALAGSLDFQYMRTVFVRDAKAEDGFAFLSDAFVRRLVGPATRIKQLRRQQARAAMMKAGAAAVFAAMETGRLPGSLADVVAGAGLPAEELEVPEGKPVSWDAKAARASSEAYGTLEFSTPLVDLPIDRVTAREKGDYDQFRLEYLNLWRRFFDPVGIRFKVGSGPTRVEVYLLPLVNNSAYNNLRETAGQGTVRYSPARIPETTVFRWFSHLTLPSWWTTETGPVEWGLVHLDGQDLNLGPLVDYLIAAEQVEVEVGLGVALYLFVRQPFLVSLGVKEPKKVLQSFERLVEELPMNPFPRKPDASHRGVAVRAWGKRPATLTDAAIGGKYALSSNEALLKRWIDETLDEGKAKPSDLVEVNTSLYFAPPGGKNRDAIAKLLEWETHKQAMSALATWQLLYRAGVVRPEQPEDDRAAVARRLLGYVPTSPDGTAVRYDARRREARNDRHGSLDRPTLQPALKADAAAMNLLRQLRSVRADLRFREDGIHTTVTIDWVK